VLTLALSILTGVEAAEVSQSSSTNYTLRIGAVTGGGTRSSDGLLEGSAGQTVSGESGDTLKSGVQVGTNQPPEVATSSMTPAAGGNTSDNTPTLSWTYSDPEDQPQMQFHAQVSSDNFATFSANSGVTTSSSASYDVPDNIGQGSFLWRVRAFDGFDWSGFQPLASPFGIVPAEEKPPFVEITPPPKEEAEGDGTEDEPAGFDDPEPSFTIVPSEFLDLTEEELEVIELFEILEENSILKIYFELRTHSGILINSGEIVSRKGIKLSDFTVKFDDLPDNHYRLRVYTVYKDGRESAETLFHFMVDTVPPVITVLNPLNGSLLGFGEEKPDIEVGIFDTTAGVDLETFEISLDTSDTLEISVPHTYTGEPRDPKSGSSGILVYDEYAPPFSDGLGEGLVTARIGLFDLVGNEAVHVWQFMIDKSAPTGSVEINEGASDTYQTVVTLRIETQWGESEAPVAEIKLRNDDLNFSQAEWMPFDADAGPYITHKTWVLKEEAGLRTVYVRLRDEAGNESSDTVIKDSITLIIQYPDTFITKGPTGVVDVNEATFAYESNKSKSMYKVKLDNAPWSEWVSERSVVYAGLAPGNHYFQVKAGKDVNTDGVISPDEEDPVPATRSWVVGGITDSGVKEPPVRFWRHE